MSLDSLRFVNGRQIVDATRVKTIMKPGVPRLPPLPAASCNGLILISHFETNKIWVLWNPLTRELHEPDIDKHLVGSGVGYDCATDDYKVVRIDQAERVYQTHIYSLKSKSWKMIQNCPFVFPPSTTGWDHGVYLNGTLHWRSREMIIALDLKAEEYRRLPAPPAPADPLSYIYLDALNGELIISFCNSYALFEMWLLEDYGAEGSWMKLFSLRSLDYSGDLWCMRPVAYLKNKGQILLQNDATFLWLDTNKNITKKFKIKITDFPHSCTCQICRLEESCDGKKRKRKQKSDRRLKFSVTVASTKYRLNSDCASDSTWFDDDGEDY